MHAFRVVETIDHGTTYGVLKPAGAHLVDRISSGTAGSIEPELYESFSQSSERWLGSWSQVVEPMLRLHHPTEPSALHGLRFIQDPAGAITRIHCSRSRRKFLVQLCLGVARRLIEEEKYTEAQVAMEFAKEHFPEIVLLKAPVEDEQASVQWRVRREQENLDMLDSLVPT